MSSSEGSDEEFESADEDLDFDETHETSIKQRKYQLKDEKSQLIVPQIENTEEISDQKTSNSGKISIVDRVVDKDMIKVNEKTIDLIEENNESISSERLEDKQIENELKTDFKISDDLKNDLIIDKNEEQKTVIKGRKLLRKADRISNQTTTEDSEVLELKKNEVLNKLSDLSEDNSTKWNNWFSDIKSAALTATSTTVSHVSQASNNWSFDPKSMFSSAATITSHFGTGISSVVENVSSVVDSAIGAPPPEHMARLSVEDKAINESEDIHTNQEMNQNSDKSNFGFGLFDYTLNALESIGKKTIDVIVEDKPLDRKRINKLEKKD